MGGTGYCGQSNLNAMPTNTGMGGPGMGQSTTNAATIIFHGATSSRSSVPSDKLSQSYRTVPLATHGVVSNGSWATAPSRGCWRGQDAPGTIQAPLGSPGAAPLRMPPPSGRVSSTGPQLFQFTAQAVGPQEQAENTSATLFDFHVPFTTGLEATRSQPPAVSLGDISGTPPPPLIPLVPSSVLPGSVQPIVPDFAQNCAMPIVSDIVPTYRADQLECNALQGTSRNVQQSPCQPPQSRGSELKDGELRAGDKVEVWSNSSNTWCPGTVQSIEHDQRHDWPMVYVHYQPPQGTVMTKGVPLGHKHLRQTCGAL